jgi:hypothetical protein
MCCVMLYIVYVQYVCMNMHISKYIVEVLTTKVQLRVNSKKIVQRLSPKAATLNIGTDVTNVLNTATTRSYL